MAKSHLNPKTILNTGLPLAAGLLLLFLLVGSTPQPANAQQEELVDFYGLNFVHPAEPWLSLATGSGAGVMRWQFNWRDIEPARDNWTWGVTDQLVAAWNGAGLSIHAILHNPPDYALQTPGGLVPANAHLSWNHTDNRWGTYCHEFAKHYRGRIGSYEVWNEPDLKQFFEGSAQEYFYVLRSCYMGIKAADPDVPVSMAGMAMVIEPEFYPEVVRLTANDPNGAANNHYFDAANVHSYVSPELVYELTTKANAVMSQYGMRKPVWITETNIPLRGAGIAPDYPFWRYATQDEAAWYVLQAVSMAYASGADRIMFFRLADDGMDEAFGLVSGQGEPRPSYRALQLASSLMRDIVDAERSVRNGIVITRMRRADGARIVTMYSVTGRTVDLEVPAEMSAGVLINAVGGYSTIEPNDDGNYIVTLLPARGRNFSRLEDYSVGGPPQVIVEFDEDGPITGIDAQKAAANTGEAIVRWEGDDGQYGTGVASYDVELSVNEGTWLPWLTGTTDGSGVFDISQGGTFSFRARATDHAGNVGEWSNPDSVQLVATLIAQIVDLRGQPVSFVRVERDDGTLYDADQRGEVTIETLGGQIAFAGVDGSAHGTLFPAPVDVPLGQTARIMWTLEPRFNLVADNQFDNGLGAWNITNAQDVSIVDVGEPQGNVMRLNGGRRPWGTPGAGIVISVPREATSAVMRFIHRMPLDQQVLRVRVIGDDGQRLVWQSTQATAGFEPILVELGPFAGQEIELRFELWGEKGRTSMVEVDEVVIANIPVVNR